MTEKRFEMVITGADGSFHYLDKNTGEKITSTLELENKLNEQHEQIQRLKENIGELLSVNVEEELLKENEQLKAINKYLIEILEHNGATVEIEHIKGDVE